MIPANIERQHILQAIQKVAAEGVPPNHESTKFDLVFRGKLYPPKYIISVANEFANSERWSHENFSGGTEANSFLITRGFDVVPKAATELTLTPYQDYTREEVHDIFAPGTRFISQRGTWGILGIVPIPNRAGDFVFLVTLGQQTGKHLFDEGITEDGVLTWQSQPKQSLNDTQIKQFTLHDELVNSVYLFLRTRKGIPYTYLGRLKYLSHDIERENPVHFKWQILDWNVPSETL